MKHSVILILALALGSRISLAQRTVINLNGTREFDQTTTAFPTEKFARTIERKFCYLNGEKTSYPITHT